MPRASRILLVEDDAPLAELVQRFLERSGFEVTVCGSGSEVDQVLEDGVPDLMILDVMLPGEDGLSVCARIRSTFEGPILILTARRDELDEITGLDAGADDYLAKPVRPQVLLARIRALLRRFERTSGDPPIIVAGEVTVDRSRREVRVGPTAVSLTSAEFELLCCLAARWGEVVSRNDLYLEVRGVPYDGLDRSIDMRVSKLRRKLGDDPKHPRLLKAVRGVGYLFTGDIP